MAVRKPGEDKNILLTTHTFNDSPRIYKKDSANQISCIESPKHARKETGRVRQQTQSIYYSIKLSDPHTTHTYLTLQ